MSSVVTIVALILGALLITTATVGVVAVHSLRRRLRVSPRVRSRVPLRWLWLPSAGARLHRRLQNAAAIARATAARSDVKGWVGSEFPALVSEIEAEALRIDRDLGDAARHPSSTRRQLYGAVDKRVVALEATVGRLLATAADWSACTSVEPMRPLDRVDERLDALRAAAGEVAAAESASTPSTVAPRPSGTGGPLGRERTRGAPGTGGPLPR